MSAIKPLGILALLAAPLQAGLIAHYPFDGNANDATAGGHHLSGYAANQVDLPEISSQGGRTGGCARFDGQNLLVNTTYMPVIGNADRTFMMFFKTRKDNSTSSSNTTMAFGGWGSADAGTRVRYDLLFESALNTKFRNEYNSGFTASSATTALNGGMWHHVALVWTAANNTATYYLDGQPYGSAVAAGALNTGGGASDIGIVIGGDSRAAVKLTVGTAISPYRYFTGDIDEVRVYDNALSAADVLAYFNDMQANGPQIIMFEPDLPISPPGATRTLRYQLSTGVSAATIDQGIGSVMPVDSIGYGTVTVTPTATTEYTLNSLRSAVAAQAKTSIRVSSVPLLLQFRRQSALNRARMFVFFPDSTKNYYLTRSEDLADEFPFTVASFELPSIPYQEVIDNTAPSDRAFYRLEEITP